MIKIGIIGKPNVGKSTFFYASTLQPVKIASFPFTTIEPNEATGYVKLECVERYFRVKCNPREGYCIRGYRFVPIKLVDVAGLVPEAHKGKGLGNKFLDDLRQADVLLNIIDISGSTDEEGNVVGPGNYNPLKDFEWIETEINQWFFSIIRKNAEKIKRRIETDKTNAIKVFYEAVSGLGVKKDHILKALRKLESSLIEVISDHNLLFEFSKLLREYSKPIVYVANKIDLEHGHKFYEKALKKFKDKVIVPASAYVEMGLRILVEKGKIEYIPGSDEIKVLDNDNKVKSFVEYAKEKVIAIYKSTGVQDAINVAVLNVLGYIPVYPVANPNLTDSEGRILPDCFLMPKGSTVLDLAEKIHTDIAKGFIRAIELKSKKLIGKDYKLQPNDVIQIIT